MKINILFFVNNKSFIDHKQKRKQSLTKGSPKNGQLPTRRNAKLGDDIVEIDEQSE